MDHPHRRQRVTRLQPVDAIELEPSGVRLNRRFFLIDARDRMVNAKHLGGHHWVAYGWNERN